MKITLNAGEVIGNLELIIDAIKASISNPYIAGVPVRDLLGNPLGVAAYRDGELSLEIGEGYTESLRTLASLLDAGAIREIRDYAGHTIGTVECVHSDSEDSDYDDSEDSDYDDSEDSDA